MVAVRGAGREVAGLPLPAFDPAREPELLGLGGAMAPDDPSTDPISRLTAAVAQAERLATVAAAFRDELVAAAYREGAAEYAARLTDLPAAQRREWGARGMLAELACALRVPEMTLSRRLARRTALGAFPRFREANAAGLVSSWHCDVMLDLFGHVDDEGALAAADEALVDEALTVTASELRVAARRWRARHVPRTAAERRRNLADRRVEVCAADDDLCWLSALLPAAQAMAIYHRLSDIAATASGPDEPRTTPQLRADALCDLLLAPDGAAGGTVADGLRGITPTVVLTVPALALLGQSDEPADLEGFGPIDIETARELASRAPSFIRVLTHPETGAVLSVGRDRYRVPADLRTALVVRDGRCRFPGCRRRAVRCDIDHAEPWERGGRTEADNLECLCRKHHRLKHQLGWAVAHRGGGELDWTSPAGRRYSTRPSTPVTRASPPPATPVTLASPPSAIPRGDEPTALDARGPGPTGPPCVSGGPAPLTGVARGGRRRC